MMFDHTDLKSLDTLSDVLDSILDHIEDSSIADLGIQIYKAGLMGVQIPWFLKAIAWLRNFDELTSVSILYRGRPELARNLLETVKDHMQNGTDLTDPNSVGGYNHDELNQLAELLIPYVQALMGMIDEKVVD